jgi:Domain of unknown function DUF302
VAVHAAGLIVLALPADKAPRLELHSSIRDVQRKPSGRLRRTARAREHELGLLLPCNVIVHEHEGKSAVSIVDPAQMLGFVGDNPGLNAVADEVAIRLRRVVARLDRDPEYVE